MEMAAGVLRSAQSDDFVAVLLNSRAAESRGGQVVGLQQASVIAPLAAQGVAWNLDPLRIAWHTKERAQQCCGL